MDDKKDSVQTYLDDERRFVKSRVHKKLVVIVTNSQKLSWAAATFKLA